MGQNYSLSLIDEPRTPHKYWARSNFTFKTNRPIIQEKIHW